MASESAASVSGGRGSEAGSLVRGSGWDGVERRGLSDRRRGGRRGLPAGGGGERVLGLPGWLVLLLLLGLAGLPMVAGLWATPMTDAGEVWLVETTRETWRRSAALGLSGEGFSVERFVPVVSGREALDEAPGSVWMVAGAWWPATWLGREFEEVGTAELVLRGRLLSVGMALMAVAAAFWAGYALGGLPVAGLAGLIVVANPLLTLAGRTGSGEAIVLGWTVLSGASALWAMRPMKPAAALGRQAVGWGICGLSLGMTALCGGIDAALPAALPLGLLVLLCPRRPGNALGLLAAGALGLLVVLPWVAAVHVREPTAWEGWLSGVLLEGETAWEEVGGGGVGESSGLVGGVWDRLLERAGLVVKAWGIWGWVVLLALVWPFLPGASAEAGGLGGRTAGLGGRRKPGSGGGSAERSAMVGSTGKVPGPRRRLFVGWGWLVGVTAMVLLAPAGMTSGVLLATLPVGALAGGQALWSVGVAASQGRTVWVWRVAALLTGLGVLVASGLVPWGMSRLPELVAGGWFSSVFAGVMPGWYWLGVGVVLLVLALVAGVLAWGDRPERAALGWAGWSVVATTSVMLAVSQGPGLGMLRLNEVTLPDRGPVEVPRVLPADEPGVEGRGVEAA